MRCPICSSPVSLTDDFRHVCERGHPVDDPFRKTKRLVEELDWRTALRRKEMLAGVRRRDGSLVRPPLHVRAWRRLRAAWSTPDVQR